MKSSGGGGDPEGAAPSPRARKSARPRRRFTRRAVLKMLAMMEQTPDSNHDPVQDFLTSGRTGRRNAMPDILGEHAATSTAELPACIQKLSTTDASASSSNSTSQSSGVTPTTPNTSTVLPSESGGTQGAPSGGATNS
uniref:Uncharacterized protein n=1 Tax=Timema cristinae TaxID=61476 RepID=A0A7R9H7W0_TIMCR|nr:unnamed protein product [Timema cristinae]